MDQGDLSLPSRAYYLDYNVTGGILDAYAEFIESTAMALGAVDQETVSQDVADLLDFETAIAMVYLHLDKIIIYSIYCNWSFTDFDPHGRKTAQFSVCSEP